MRYLLTRRIHDTDLLHGHLPMLTALPADQTPSTDIIAPITSNYITIVSDIALGAVTAFLGTAHFLGWFVLSPYPIELAATAGALGAPFLVWLRISDAWHRRRLSKFLADAEMQKQLQ